MSNNKLTSTASTLIAEQTSGDTSKFAVDDWTRLERFLILGTEQGRYETQRKQVLTLESSKALERCIHIDGKRVIDTAVNISELGRAPKNDVAIFTMAAASKLGNDEVRKHTYENLHRVLRTGTHVLDFMSIAKALKKSGRGLRKAVSNWYLVKNADQAAYQMLKYQQRNGMSQSDVLRIVHTGHYNGHKQEGFTKEHSNLFKYMVDGELHGNTTKIPRLLEGFIAAKQLGITIEKAGAADKQAIGKAVALITDYGLTREMLPTQLLNHIEVWEALLEKMPLTAMVRNLGKMTSIELIKPGSDAEKKVIARLCDEAYLKKSKVHPIQILMAERTYRSGHGLKGKLSWAPVPSVTKVLDVAFYTSFVNAPTTNKRYYVGVDCSGSMSSAFAGSAITSIEAAMAMAMVLLHTEPDVYIAGYASGSGRSMGRSSGMKELGISKKMYLSTATQKALALSWGSTDCGLPYRDALIRNAEYDVFVNITDSDHNSGASPASALRNYRVQTGIPAKQVVIGTENTSFSIADPNDAGSLDIAGFDAAIPALLADFASDGKVREKYEEDAAADAE